MSSYFLKLLEFLQLLCTLNVQRTEKMNNPIQTEHLLQFLQECKDMSSKTDTRNNIIPANTESEVVIKDDNPPQGITFSFSNFKIDIKFLGTK